MIKISNKAIKTSEAFLQQANKGWEKLLAREEIGFFRLPEREDIWLGSAQRGQQIHHNYDRLAILGLGGSSLGGLALRDALAPYADTVDFFDNIDAKSFWGRMACYTDLETVHWLIISKSGSTMETLTLANFVAQHLSENGLEFAKHVTVISETRENPLTFWARENDVPVLEIPVDVGGRFSVLTPVGLVMASFLGIDVEALRKGARWALEQRDLVCELAAQSLASFEREEWLTLLWIYSDDLKTYGDWFQQLWAESLGKRVKRDGTAAPRVSSPFSLRGASDQHSVLQQVAEGAKDKFVIFLRVSESENSGPILRKQLFADSLRIEGRGLGELLAAEAEATQTSLAEEGVSTMGIKVERLDEPTLGALFMFMELTVGVIGECLEINTFDQPGVEAGKKVARKIINS